MENKNFKKIQEDDEKTVLSQNISKEDSKIPLFKNKDQNIISQINSNYDRSNHLLKIQGVDGSMEKENTNVSINPKMKFFKEKEYIDSFIKQKYDDARKLAKTDKIVIYN